MIERQVGVGAKTGSRCAGITCRCDGDGPRDVWGDGHVTSVT